MSSASPPPSVDSSRKRNELSQAQHLDHKYNTEEDREKYGKNSDLDQQKKNYQAGPLEEKVVEDHSREKEDNKSQGSDFALEEIVPTTRSKTYDNYDDDDWGALEGEGKEQNQEPTTPEDPPSSFLSPRIQAQQPSVNRSRIQEVLGDTDDLYCFEDRGGALVGSIAPEHVRQQSVSSEATKIMLREMALILRTDGTWRYATLIERHQQSLTFIVDQQNTPKTIPQQHYDTEILRIRSEDLFSKTERTIELYAEGAGDRADEDEGGLETQGGEKYLYDGFLSYRVWCDTDVVEKLYYALSLKGLAIFWDKVCLEPGPPWEEGFVRGLKKSRHVISVISEQALEGLTDATSKQDNVLKEWELAVDRLDSDNRYIIPVLLGKYVEAVSGGQKALQRFNAFGGLMGKPWPERNSKTCASRTIKDTMERLFAIQGIHVDPQAIHMGTEEICKVLTRRAGVGYVLDKPAEELAARHIKPAVHVAMDGAQFADAMINYLAAEEFALPEYQLGKKQIEDGQYESAIVSLRDLLLSDCSQTAKYATSSLLAFALVGQGKEFLRSGKFEKAEAHFEEAVAKLPKKKYKRACEQAQFYHAYSVYSHAKSFLRKHDYQKAKLLFEKSLTKQQGLKQKQKAKANAWIKDCSARVSFINKRRLEVSGWLSKNKLGNYVDAVIEEGYDDLTDLIELDKSDLEDLGLTVGMKPGHIKKFVRLVNNEGKSTDTGIPPEYAEARACMASGNFHEAIAILHQVLRIRGVASDVIARAERDIAHLHTLLNEQKTMALDMTHYMTQTVAMDMTSTISLPNLGKKQMEQFQLVLNCKFPPDSAARTELINLLTTDLSTALQVLPMRFVLLNMERGSVIAKFAIRKGTEASEPTATRAIESYWAQVQDENSHLYNGKITRTLDRERTMQISTQVFETTPEKRNVGKHELGEKLSLWRHRQHTVTVTVEALLGVGACGNVYCVSYGNKKCALKVYRASNGFRQLCDEASILLRLNYPNNHANVLSVDFIRAKGHQIFFLLGLADGGDLRQWINDERLYAGTEEEQQQRLNYITSGIASGLNYLHSRGILHEDMKSENVLMTQDGIPVVADFGVSAIGKLTQGRNGHEVAAVMKGGTPAFCSPRMRAVFQRLKCCSHQQREKAQHWPENLLSHSDDIWCFAATVVDLHADLLWRAGNQSAAEIIQQNGGSFSHVAMRVEMNSGLKELLQKCFSDAISDKPQLTVQMVINELEHTGATSRTDGLQKDGVSKHLISVIHNNLGNALLDREMFDCAESQYRAALDLSPNEARATNNLGVAFQARGMMVEALSQYKAALKLDPNHSQANKNLGQMQHSAAGTQAKGELDRSGTEEAIGVSDPAIEIENAVQYTSGQRLMIRQHGKWVHETVVNSEDCRNLALRNHFVAINKSHISAHIGSRVRMKGTGSGLVCEGTVRGENSTDLQVQLDGQAGLETVKIDSIGSVYEAAEWIRYEPGQLLRVQLSGHWQWATVLKNNSAAYRGLEQSEWPTIEQKRNQIKPMKEKRDEQKRQMAKAEKQMQKEEKATAQTKQHLDKQFQVAETKRQMQKQKRQVAETKQQLAEQKKQVAKAMEQMQELAETEQEQMQELAETEQQLAKQKKKLDEIKAQKKTELQELAETEQQLDLYVEMQQEDKMAKAQVAETKQQLAKQKEQVAGTKQQIQKQETAVAKTKQKIQEQKDKMDIGLVKNIEQMQEQEAAVAETKQQLAKQKEQVADTEQQIQEEEKAMEQMQELAETEQQLAKQKKKLDEIKAQKNTELQELAEMQQEDKMAKAQVAETKQQLAKQKEQVAGTKQQIQKQETAVAKTKQKIQEQKDKMDIGLVKNIEQMQEQEAAVAETKQQLAKQKEQVADTEQQIQEEESEIAQLTKSVSKALRPLWSMHEIEVASSVNGAKSTTVNLTAVNHSPALLTQLESTTAVEAYRIYLTDLNAHIYDAFSNTKLDTLTQTVSLQYCKANSRGSFLQTAIDLDLSANASERNAELSTDCTQIVDKLFSRPPCQYVDGSWVINGVLVLGPAASGKTTLLKRFTMEILARYSFIVPVIIPVIELMPVLAPSDDSSSILSRYLKIKFRNNPGHVRLVLQAVSERSALVMVDGMDESGSGRQFVERFIADELLGRGQRCIITSRWSGVSADAFKTCEIVELVPLDQRQVADMVHMRIKNKHAADAMIAELTTEAYQGVGEEPGIATNPLMLTMALSVAENNAQKLPENRASLYAKAFTTMIKRIDQYRKGTGVADIENVIAALKRIAFRSHIRGSQFRNFTATQAKNWTDDSKNSTNEWTMIKALVKNGRLPLLVPLVQNGTHEEEYRFSHLTFQEFLVAKRIIEIVDQQKDSLSVQSELMQVFGIANAFAAKWRICSVFTLAKWQLVLRTSAEVLMEHNEDISRLRNMSAVLLSSTEIVLDAGVKDQGALALEPYLKVNETVTMLDVSKAELGNSGARIIGRAIAANQVLMKLKMHTCSLQVREIKTAKELNLSNTNLHSHDVIAISASLSLNNALKKLDLSNNTALWGDDGSVKGTDLESVAALAEALPQCTALTKLTWRDGDAVITFDGAKKELDLSDHELTPMDAKFIAGILPNCSTLIKLNISIDGLEFAHVFKR